MKFNLLTRFCSVAVLFAALSLLSGCAVVMAAKQPSKKNLDLFAVGTPRSLVVAEFGSPIDSIVKDGSRVEIYKWTQGYSGGVKAGRAILHGAADLFTLGLWEIAGTPIEGMANGREMAVEVQYDSNAKIKETKLLKEEGKK